MHIIKDMKHLGIDYGTKNIGLATSDDFGTIAFPHSVIKNDEFVLEKIGELVEASGLRTIILGKSLDYDQKDNPVMAKIEIFKKALEETTRVPVHYELEFLTSIESTRLPGKGGIPKEKQKELKKEDSSAAALILQSYLDRKNNNHKS